MEKLFSNATIGNYITKNSIAMAPMTRSRAESNMATAMMAEYYAQRASAGLIITEGVAPHANGLGYARIPGIFTTTQMKAWQQVADAVHQKGGLVFMQLMHTGRIGHADNMPADAQLVGPSALAAHAKIYIDGKGLVDMPQPHSLQIEQIHESIASYAQAAQFAIDAGFDGVELHAASGYLPNQFLATNANIRTDAYGGSFQNRARYVLEMVHAVCNTIGSNKVGIKFSPGMAFNDIHINDSAIIYQHLLEALNKQSLAYVHVMHNEHHINQPGGFEPVLAFRNWYKGRLLVGGGLTAQSGETMLQQGLADMAVYGALFIANPDLPHRFKHGLPLTEAKKHFFYTPGPQGYTDYM
jgi:N-ethylmaleimide reductase